MENKLAKLYNEIGAKIVSTIPVRWEKIYYLGEVTIEKSSWSSVFYYTEENSTQYVESNDIPEKYKVPKTIYDKLMDEINEILLAIYDCFIIRKILIMSIQILLVRRWHSYWRMPRGKMNQRYMNIWSNAIPT